MTANFIGASTVVHPVVVVRINGYKFRALLDSGASHSYTSSTAAIQLIGAKCKSAGIRQIAMFTGVTT
jgi:predicted aspartyl protease